MSQKTKPDVWPTDHTVVVYLVPAERSFTYSLVMKQLTLRVLKDLGWTTDDIEVIGLVAATPQNGTESILFLEESGIDTRGVTLLMLWGETSRSVNLYGHVSEECGIGAVALPSTGVVLPTVLMPSIDTDWWKDPMHQEFAAVTYASMIRGHRRYVLDGSEPTTFVTYPATWN